MIRIEITPCDVGAYRFRAAKAKLFCDGNWHHVGFPKFFATLTEALAYSRSASKA